MSDQDLAALYMSAERRWMDKWVEGPTLEGEALRRGHPAPDVELATSEGNPIQLASFWADRPALVLLWRHLGCGCGIDRAELLQEQLENYEDAGLEVAPGPAGQPHPKFRRAVDVLRP